MNLIEIALFVYIKIINISTYIMTLLCRRFFMKLPESALKNTSKLKNSNIVVDNIQIDDKIITKKAIMIMNFLMDVNPNDLGTYKFFINDFMKFIGHCSMIYIDYHIAKESHDKEKIDLRRIKKIISLEDMCKPTYIARNGNKVSVLNKEIEL